MVNIMEALCEADSIAGLRVGITYNLKKGILSEAADFEAEYDHLDTVLAIQQALEEAGCLVIRLEADRDLPEKLKDDPPDIVFNIAEGSHGRGREAQVPAILHFLGIPFTGSDETTLCIALDKALTKRILASYKIRTPHSRVFTPDEAVTTRNVTFPSIVKPNAEGSSKGITDHAIVYDRTSLLQQLKNGFRLYGCDMLVEPFIRGREVTVGLLGNGSCLRVFSPMEIIYLQNKKDNIYSYTTKQNWKEQVRYECPARLEPGVAEKVMQIAGKIYKILDCHDFARIDFRIDEQNQPWFIEINPLPGLAPGYSDYPMLASFCGMDYNYLIQSILRAAIQRHAPKAGIYYDTRRS